MAQRAHKLSAFDSTVDVWRDAATRERDAFLAAWPIERLPEMTLEEYVIGTGKETFSWWLERGTQQCGSIGGIWSTQFGVYFKPSTGQYLLMPRSKLDPETAFGQIRALIVRAAKAGRERDFDDLVALEPEAKGLVSPVVLRKVAVLYQPQDAPFILPVCTFEPPMKTIYGQELPNWVEGQRRFFSYKPDADYWQRAYEATQPLRDINLAAADAAKTEKIIQKRKEEADITTEISLGNIDSGQYAEVLDLLRRRKNVILQGAPGTGKTYAVPEIVTRLCGVAPKSGSRADVMKAWKQLLDEKRVAVVTFHPSLDYEDFVEGWRPVSNETEANGEHAEASVELVDGIFKKICAVASVSAGPDDRLKAGADVWKVSLAGTGDNAVRRDCLQKGRIRIGWDQYGEDPTEAIASKAEGWLVLRAFYERMRVGDIIVSCWSNTSTDAVGIVTGEPEWLPEDGLGFRISRRVEWLWKGKPADITGYTDGVTMTLGTVYSLKIRFDVPAVQAFLTERGALRTKRSKEPCVLVIDEINRGNISKIFGELITLIEPDKRAGGASETAVTLAYSGKSFTIPENLYILGTMNTADRSLGAIDYALRRRFGFHRLRPQVLEDERFDKDLFLAVSALFVKNPEAAPEERVEPNTDTMTDAFEPEDVWPGHSYFLMEDDDARSFRWHREIRPLLLEYVRDGVLKKSALERIDSIESEFAL